MSHDAPPSPGEQQLYVFDKDDEQCGRGPGTPTFRLDVQKTGGHQFKAIQREAAVIPRVLVERMAEGRDEMRIAAGSEDACDLLDHLLRELHVLQNGITLDTREETVRKRQAMSVGGDIDSRHGEKIDVDVAWNPVAGPADIQIPASQGIGGRLSRIKDEGLRRSQQRHCLIL